MESNDATGGVKFVEGLDKTNLSDMNCAHMLVYRFTRYTLAVNDSKYPLAQAYAIQFFQRSFLSDEAIFYLKTKLFQHRPNKPMRHQLARFLMHRYVDLNYNQISEMYGIHPMTAKSWDKKFHMPYYFDYDDRSVHVIFELAEAMLEMQKKLSRVHMSLSFIPSGKERGAI